MNPTPFSNFSVFTVLTLPPPSNALIPPSYKFVAPPLVRRQTANEHFFKAIFKRKVKSNILNIPVFLRHFFRQTVPLYQRTYSRSH